MWIYHIVYVNKMDNRDLADCQRQVNQLAEFVVEVAVKQLRYIPACAAQVFRELGAVHPLVLHKLFYLTKKFHLNFRCPICWAFQKFLSFHCFPVFNLFIINFLSRRNSDSSIFCVAQRDTARLRGFCAIDYQQQQSDVCCRNSIELLFGKRFLGN